MKDDARYSVAEAEASLLAPGPEDEGLAVFETDTELAVEDRTELDVDVAETDKAVEVLSDLVDCEEEVLDAMRIVRKRKG